MSFGDYFRKKRLQQRLTLRAFCKRFGFDTAYISRLENNKMRPPEDEKLSVLAESLSLEKNSRDWVRFFDLAYQSREKLPKDIIENASDVVSLLPAFLRTPDGKKVSKEKLERLTRFLQTGGKEPDNGT